MKTSRFLSILIAAFLAFGSSIRAQVIFDNTGGATTFTPAAGWSIASNQEIAIQFTSGASSFLDFAEVEVWNGIGSINVGLFANGAGTPGSLLEAVNVALPLGSGPQALIHVEFSNTTLLTAGSIYWLGVSPGAGTSTAWEIVAPTGNLASDGDIGFGDPWTSVIASQGQGGMRLVGAPNGITAVPEPSTYGLIGSALLLGLIALRRRMKSC